MTGGAPRTTRPTAARARCLVVQHVEAEGPYIIAEVLAGAGVKLDLRALPTGAGLPSNLDGYQGIVVMGGPVSATSDAGFPTRVAEMSLLEQALERGVPTLGTCLGAQLLALAAGGKVYAGMEGPEIGWGSVSLAEEARTDPILAGLPGELTVLHWHSDTFDVPPASKQLASTRLYPNQAFRVGNMAWGLQFHLEVNSDAIQAFLAVFGDEARAAGVEPEAIAAEAPLALAQLAVPRRRVFERFAALVRARAARG